MNQWDHFFLVAIAAVPGPALLALSCIVYFLRRRIGAVSAVLMSLGAALCPELFISVVVHASDLLYPLCGSLVGLIGLPLVAYVGTLLWLTTRWRISQTTGVTRRGTGIASAVLHRCPRPYALSLWNQPWGLLNLFFACGLTSASGCTKRT